MRWVPLWSHSSTAIAICIHRSKHLVELKILNNNKWIKPICLLCTLLACPNQLSQKLFFPIYSTLFLSTLCKMNRNENQKDLWTSNNRVFNDRIIMNELTSVPSIPLFPNNLPKEENKKVKLPRRFLVLLHICYLNGFHFPFGFLVYQWGCWAWTTIERNIKHAYIQEHLPKYISKLNEIEAVLTRKLKPVTPAIEMAMEVLDRESSPKWPTIMTEITCNRYCDKVTATIGPAKYPNLFTSTQTAALRNPSPPPPLSSSLFFNNNPSSIISWCFLSTTRTASLLKL